LGPILSGLFYSIPVYLISVVCTCFSVLTMFLFYLRFSLCLLYFCFPFWLFLRYLVRVWSFRFPKLLRLFCFECSDPLPRDWHWRSLFFRHGFEFDYDFTWYSFCICLCLFWYFILFRLPFIRLIWLSISLFLRWTYLLFFHFGLFFLTYS
jgi:hypothetical protein